MNKQLVILSFIILVFIALMFIIYIQDWQIISQRDNESQNTIVNESQNTIVNENTSNEKIIKIKYDEIPSYADSKVVNNAIIDAIDSWSTINDGLTIQVSSSNDYDIHIEWKRTLNGKQLLGRITGNLIEVSLGDIDCYDNWRVYSTNAISHIISHEIGHYLGLGHTSDINHLMYEEPILIKSVKTISGEIVTMQDNFDDLGYNIPLIDSIHYAWNVPDELQLEYDELQLEYDELTIKRDQLQKVYDQYNERNDAEWDYDESMNIYKKLHNLQYDVNTIFIKMYHVNNCQSYFDATKY